MPRFKDIDGKRIQLTAEEEAVRNAKDVKHTAELHIVKWKDQMFLSDSLIPRYVEDILDGMNPTDRANVSQATLDNLAYKKALRATRP